MRVVNLTPHPIRILRGDGEVDILLSSGAARVKCPLERESGGNGIIFTQRESWVEGLPDPRKDTLLIVSSIAFLNAPERIDLGTVAFVRSHGDSCTCRGFTCKKEFYDGCEERDRVELVQPL